MEVRASERKEVFRDKSVLSRILKRDELTHPVKDHADILPKNVQQAVEVLKADVQHFNVDGDTIFLVKIPLL